MDFYVKMKTAILGLLISFSLAGCGSSGGYYPDMATNNAYNQPRSIYDVVVNIGKHSAYSVPKNDRIQHENCVYFALDNANVGESCKWRGQVSNGTVRVSAIYPSGCHDLMSTIWYKGRTKSWTDRACYYDTTKQWKFM